MNFPLPTTAANPIDQACTVPFRVRDGAVEVCLITSMGRGRWIFPKGVVDPGETHVITAQKEAWEEAGIEGSILQPALGQYRDSKWNAPLLITVFAMLVEVVHETWPEEGLRRRCWAPLDDARELISDAILRQMLELAVKRVQESVRKV